MRFSPLLLLHICAGTLGFLAGAVAVVFRKGSRRHGLAGNVFVISMLTMSASGVYLALVKSNPGTALGGVLTFYLVATAWATARRRDNDTGIFAWREPLGILDWGAFAAALALGAVIVTYAVEALNSPTGKVHGYPAGLYFYLGFVTLLAASGDVKMLVRHGISGTQRTARHLWRMCFAWFVASGSIFLARAHLFPAIMRKTGVLVLLSFLPLIVMVFWLIRIRVTRRSKRRSMPVAGDAYSLRA
jgi:uncharacterized membrane protein